MTYDEFKHLKVSIDMTRGKPSAAQLDLSISGLGSLKDQYLSRDGIDCRNYGHPLGLPEAREFGSELLGTHTDQVVAAGNASLELMHDAIVFGMLYGMPGGKPWRPNETAFLCPVPGYDRHFAICAALGIRMIPVPLTGEGPDLDFVEAQVAGDASIKGMWCMPSYSNPSGEVYSTSTVQRLASMQTAAPHFRLFWDDAYRFHHLIKEGRARPVNMIELCEQAGHPDRALVFASLSKVTYAGAGVAFLASSQNNIAWWQRCSAVRTIGPDKLNQLRHVRFLRNFSALERLMDLHSALLRPKFDAVTSTFSELLSGTANVTWTKPLGGYFISLYGPRGLAKRTVELAAEAGIAMTPAGAAFPLGMDPEDRHMRIAPSFPKVEDVKLAAQGIALSLRRAIEEKA